MSKFLKLNKGKLKSIFFRMSLLFLALIALFLLVAYLFKGFLFDKQILIIILIIAIFVLPSFVMLIAYVGWINKNFARVKAFSTPGFVHLSDIGFEESYKNENSKWAYTELIQETTLNGYTLRVDVSTQKNHIIEIEIPTAPKSLDKYKVERLSQVFSQHNVVFKNGKVVKEYNSNKPEFSNVSELMEDLELFTELLRQEGFVPKK